MVRFCALRLRHVCSRGWVVHRGTEKEEAIEKRLKNARREMERSSDASLFDHILVNDDLETTYAKMKVAPLFCSYTHACTHTWSYMYLYTNVFSHLLTFIHIYIYSYIHIIHHAYMHTYLHTSRHTYIHTGIQAYVQTCIPTCIHTYMFHTSYM